MEESRADKRELILVVDEDASHRRCARDVLEQAGFAVEEAPDGASALRFAERRRPGLVLVDMDLPGMDGSTRRSCS